MFRFITRAAAARFSAASLLALLAFAHADRARAVIFTGKPDLPLTASMIAAGGGAHDFSSARLLEFLAGPRARGEVTKLTNQFGARDVRSSLVIFNYAVDDAARIVTASGIKLPPPSVSDGTVLSSELYEAGITPRGFWDVGYMLEHLITHPVHHLVMRDIDRRYGPKRNATFHIVLAQMMDDLATDHRSAAH